MTEELEKEARFCTKGWKEQENCVQAYIAGAKPREKRIADFEAQIEKMKCCENCKHDYDEEQYITTDYCNDCFDFNKWEVNF